VLARYLTGILCAGPIVLHLLRPGVDRTRTVALVVLGGLPWVATLMAYNAALSGSPWRLTTTPATVSRWFADGVVLRGADILATHLLRHLLWTPPALIVAYLVYLRAAPRDTRRGLLDWILPLVAGALYFFLERGGNQYGPRFHYEAFLFAALFVAANVFREPGFFEKSRRDRWLFALLTVSVMVMPLSFSMHAVVERKVIRERMDPYTMAAAAGLRDALVLVSGRVGTARSMAALDLTRNPVDHQASVLYGVDPGEDKRCAPTARLPGRTTYLYAWDPLTSRGSLLPVVCP
jgi:hypothetical protein